jgi:SAM-dependent methyltransferase
MAPENEINIQEVMAGIRQRVEARKQKGEAFAPIRGSARPQANVTGRIPQLYPLAQIEFKIASARLAQTEIGAINPRRPGFHNNLIQVFKKAIRRSLSWYTRPLMRFHSAVVDSLSEAGFALKNVQGGFLELNRAQAEEIEHVRDELSKLREELSKLREEQSEMRRKESEGRDELSEVRDRGLRLNDGLQRIIQTVDGPGGMFEKLRANERSLRRIASMVQPSPAYPSPNPLFPTSTVRLTGPAEFDYFVFEERFRGDEATIKNRQKSYLDLFEGCEDVVDLGCGRGEFLEVLRENRIPARGVETNSDMFLLCKEKGLDVVQQDLFEFLEAAPDQSFGGIFCSQVIEHLSAADQLRLVKLLEKKTKPGSPVVLETINPECVFALVRNFFLDPTHIRPVHSDMLKFACESAGFAEVKLRFSEPLTSAHIPKLEVEPSTKALESFNDAMQRLNYFLYGYQDYAVVARR